MAAFIRRLDSNVKCGRLGSSDPRNLGSAHARARRAWRGRAVAVVAPAAGGGAGAAVVTASAPGLAPGRVALRFE